MFPLWWHKATAPWDDCLVTCHWKRLKKWSRQQREKCFIFIFYCFSPNWMQKSHSQSIRTTGPSPVIYLILFFYWPYNTIIEHMSVHLFSTPVPMMDNRHIQIYKNSLCIHNMQKGTDILTVIQTVRQSTLCRYLPCIMPIEWLTACHVCIHSKFKITAYMLRLSAFNGKLWKCALLEPTTLTRCYKYLNT